MEFRFLDDTVSSTSVGVGESTFTKFDMFLEISAINAMETFTTITSANLLVGTRDEPIISAGRKN